MTNGKRRMKAEGRRITFQMRTWCILFLFIFYPFVACFNQETPATTPKSGARLEFVPPPMEGTVSMGIYDRKGKLVCALHREEEVQSDAFGKALNGLITSWDGKNDAGEPMPAGKYFARGFMVGDLAAEGEAMHGNDWITDDNSPRIRRITKILADSDKLIFFAQKADDKVIAVKCKTNGSVESSQSFTEAAADNLQSEQSGTTLAVGAESEGDVAVKLAPSNELPKISVSGGRALINTGYTTGTGRSWNGDVETHDGIPPQAIETAPGETVIDACASRGGGAWLIVQSGTDSEVREYSAQGEFKRRLAIQPGDPQPVKIAASLSSDTIFLLEDSQAEQRLRALALIMAAAATGTEQATSTWKVNFAKIIVFSETLEQAHSLLKFPDGKPFEPQDKIKVTLLPNPMAQDQPGLQEITAGFDAGGSCLKTSDGLLLKRISDTPNLKWVAIGRETGSKIIVLFQSDGAVVEEFHIAHPANMMAFDCGDFDFDPVK